MGVLPTTLRRSCEEVRSPSCKVSTKIGVPKERHRLPVDAIQLIPVEIQVLSLELDAVDHVNLAPEHARTSGCDGYSFSDVAIASA